MVVKVNVFSFTLSNFDRIRIRDFIIHKSICFLRKKMLKVIYYCHCESVKRRGLRFMKRHTLKYKLEVKEATIRCRYLIEQKYCRLIILFIYF